MAFTSVAALAGAASAGAAITATMVLAAVAEVGMALSVLGAVTGNAKLAKIGGTMSLIGGVGGMIAGATSGAAGTAAAGAAESGLSEAATEAALDAASDTAMNAYGGSAAAEAANASAISSMELAGGADLAAASAGSSGGIVGSAMQTPSMEIAQTLKPAAAMNAAPAQTLATDVGIPSAPQAPVGATGPVGAQAPYTPFESGFQGTAALSGATAPESSGSFFGKLGTWAEKNKTLLSTGMQLAGGAMKGMNESRMWDQKMALEQQRLQQSGHGNSVARFQPRSIIEGARA